MDRPVHYFDRVVHGKSAPIPTDEAAVANFECLQGIYKCVDSGRPYRIAFDDGDDDR